MSRSIRIALALLASSLLVAARWPAARSEGVRFGDPARGQRLFASKDCVRCHAVRGAGGHIGPDLGRKSARSSFHEIAAVMWNHSEGMADRMREYRVTHPVLEDDELLDLISFLYFLNYFDEPGDPRAGRVLFTEKGCVRCHTLEGVGGVVGPSLEDVPRGISPLRLTQQLWNHGPEMIVALEREGLEFPTFEGDELIDLFSYVRMHGRREGARRFESPGDPERGRVLFEEKGCSQCHAIFGPEDGSGSAGPDLGRAELRGSVTQIAGRMWNHLPAMVDVMTRAGLEVPEFEGEDLLDLFAYLYIARYRGEPGSVERGREVYAKKGCALCHGPEGGGGAGPDLRAAARGLAQDRILQDMWNHAPGMQAAFQAQNLAWARFSARELADLLAFLGREETAAGGR